MQLLYETGSISWSNKCMQANWKRTSQLKRCHHSGAFISGTNSTVFNLMSRGGGGEGIYHISETFDGRT